LGKADFTGADMRGAKVTARQLSRAASLDDVKMPDGIDSV
jgi:uncharacterized protein YjbI with pentapeptide repeats